jgi:DNA anti-recombination protein RmuC
VIALVLLFLFVGAAAVAAGLAVSRGWLAARYRQLELRCDEIAQERDRLAAEVSQLRALDTQRIAGEAVLREKTEELERVRAEAARERQSASEGVRRLDVVAERLKRLEITTQGAAAKSEAAQAGAERVEGHLLGFTKRIANPQSRGAFGEEALRNQLELLGLRENRDFRRQVKVIGSSRRIDYVVSLRGVTIGLDPKFALDPDLDGISSALAAGDEARLAGYARKLVARAKELAAKEYWSDLERSPSFVLMYVPVEGAQEVLRALPSFSHEKFASEHGVYIVTPLQLGTTLGVIADVAHLSRREEELDGVARDLTQLAQELSRFCEHYHRHGKQIAAVARSYNEGAAMLSSRGGLGRIARTSMGFARRIFSLHDEAEIPETRSDCEQHAEDYKQLADVAQSEAA